MRNIKEMENIKSIDEIISFIKDGEVIDVDVNKIKGLPATNFYPRIAANNEVVEIYALAMKGYGEYKNFPPILISDNNEIIDGVHRYLACVKNGYKQIKAIKLKNIDDDMKFLLSVKCNINHGKGFEIQDYEKINRIIKSKNFSVLDKIDDDLKQSFYSMIHNINYIVQEIMDNDTEEHYQEISDIKINDNIIFQKEEGQNYLEETEQEVDSINYNEKINITSKILNQIQASDDETSDEEDKEFEKFYEEPLNVEKDIKEKYRNKITTEEIENKRNEDIIEEKIVITKKMRGRPKKETDDKDIIEDENINNFIENNKKKINETIAKCILEKAIPFSIGERIVNEVPVDLQDIIVQILEDNIYKCGKPHWNKILQINEKYKDNIIKFQELISDFRDKIFKIYNINSYIIEINEVIEKITFSNISNIDKLKGVIISFALILSTIRNCFTDSQNDNNIENFYLKDDLYQLIDNHLITFFIKSDELSEEDKTFIKTIFKNIMI